MRDIIFYAFVFACLIYTNATAWAWAALAIGITYAIATTSYSNHRRNH
ncbi:hypothetical protein [Corynebacterium lactis]|uniref:Uncharacterized protein n=1 Tax=Corynebacterium lactis RW2-5 TaxID=1408189 RepID=A0A0K2H3B5_9CORY|nr:hypothetical protein [Corynebacterium lactis]ALA68540.1 hypothetical protein CLAC_07205 [Corynebacterium lactis RW2-5]